MYLIFLVLIEIKFGVGGEGLMMILLEEDWLYNLVML